MLKLSDNPPMLTDGVDRISALDGAWWVAHTRARAEKALAWDLINRSIPYFCPLTEKLTFSGGRRRKVLLPFFPSYVFFCGDRETRHAVLTTNRVCQVVPVIEREQLVTELEALHQALLSNYQLDHYPFAAVGRRCRVAKGPLVGIEGIVMCRDNITRLVLQISMLGQGAALEIPVDFLEPAE